jgi:hypothetical protein
MDRFVAARLAMTAVGCGFMESYFGSVPIDTMNGQTIPIVLD